MSNQSEEQPTESESDSGVGISDDQLPEDLQPTDDNPLAQSPEDHPIGRDAESEDGDDAAEKKVEGLPDAGDPGA